MVGWVKRQTVIDGQGEANHLRNKGGYIQNVDDNFKKIYFRAALPSNIGGIKDHEHNPSGY